MNAPELSRLRRVLLVIVRSIVWIAPSKVISILFEACGEALHRRGNRYVTWHTRPKRPSVETLHGVQPLLPSKEDTRIAVVMQGPLLLEDDFTLETARWYRRVWTDTRVIISTWNGENTAALDALRSTGCEIVLSDRPSAPGVQNVNFQVRSSYAGIARAREMGCEYVVKARTDQRVGNPRALGFVVDLIRQFPLRNGNGQRARIVASSFLTAAFTPFYIADQWLFGTVVDMAIYFSPPQDTCSSALSFEGLKVSEVAVPENYLAMAFLKHFGRDTSRTLRASWGALAESFVIVDREMLDIYWPKYTPNTERPIERYDSKMVWHSLSFADWLRLYREYEASAELPEALLVRLALSTVPERLRP